LASACLLQAFNDACFTGVALAPLGVAVVVGRGLSVANAAPQPRTVMKTSAAAILIRDLQKANQGAHVRRDGLSPS